MKTIEFSYGPVMLNLYMNGNAMFAIQELDNGLPKDQPDAVERMKENTADGFALVCKIAHILATQGELCRRYLQYKPRRVPEAGELLLLLAPVQILQLRLALFRSINEGYANEEAQDGGDIDTGLAELEKKTNL